ncbi:MAG: hypothetical protein ABEJ92_07505 [Halobacteriales archaeon]
MDRPNRRGLGMVAAGLLAIGAAWTLVTTDPGPYTPVVQAGGLLAALSFAWLGLWWSFAVLADAHGD